MTNDLVQRFPWEPKPQTIDAVARTIELLQEDMRYAVRHTAVVVHSNRAELQMIINTERGQIVPRGECKFTDGTTLEMQDIGMPQVGAPLASVRDLTARVWAVVAELGLEIQ